MEDDEHIIIIKSVDITFNVLSLLNHIEYPRNQMYITWLRAIFCESENQWINESVNDLK